jgi:hypothetical protein
MKKKGLKKKESSCFLPAHNSLPNIAAFIPDVPLKK